MNRELIRKSPETLGSGFTCIQIFRGEWVNVVDLEANSGSFR